MQAWTQYSQFQKAIQSNDLATTKSLLENGIDSDFRFGSTQIPALCMCSKNGHYELARTLIDYGCSVNQDDQNGLAALHYACNYRFVNIARLLIENRANVDAANCHGYTPLHLAVEHGSLDLVQLLLDSGASLEKRDITGRTPLMIACKNGNYQISKALLAKGANVNNVDQYGSTPLLTVAFSGMNIDIPLMKLLLDAGANPDVDNKIGLIPLLTIIRRSSEHLQDGQDAVQELIDHDCNINVKEYNPISYGENALSLSIQRNQDAITEKLIRAGADLSETGINTDSPFVKLVKNDKINLAKLVAARMTNISKKDFEKIELFRNDIYRSEPNLYEHLYDEKVYFPRLQHLSRVRLRSWLGRHADKVLRQIQLPFRIKNYLLLEEL